MKSPKLPVASANAPWGMMSNCEALCSKPPPKPTGSRTKLEVTRDAREREVDRVGEVVELRGHPITLAGHDAPRVLVEPVPEERLALRVLRAEMAHVARVILDLVAPGAPRGEGQEQRILATRRKLGAHVEQTRRRGWNRNLVLDRRSGLC